MTTNLAIKEQLPISASTLPSLPSPQEVVETASEQSKLLMKIVEQTKCFQQIRDKKYLMVEAWEMIGAFNNCHAVTESVQPVVEDGQTIGYQAKVQLWKNGDVVGGASMPRLFTENACKGKEKDARHKAAMSAAQTFATSKAYRMNFSHVAILAGYQPTPAEEMVQGAAQDTTIIDDVDTSKHYCKAHKVNFFKRGKMKGFAHPVKDKAGEDTGYWCNEPQDEEPPLEEEQFVDDVELI